MKQNILQVARKLFLEYGYHATSIDRICKVAGVSKGAFFHYFENKESMAIELVHEYVSQLVAAIAIEIEAVPVKRRDKLSAYVDAVAKVSESALLVKGCLIGNLIQELWKSHSQVLNACNESLETWIINVAAVIKSNSIRRPSNSARSKELARLLVSTFEGAMILAKSRNDFSIVRKQLMTYKAIVAEVT